MKKNVMFVITIFLVFAILILGLKLQISIMSWFDSKLTYKWFNTYGENFGCYMAVIFLPIGVCFCEVVLIWYILKDNIVENLYDKIIEFAKRKIRRSK